MTPLTRRCDPSSCSERPLMDQQNLKPAAGPERERERMREICLGGLSSFWRERKMKCWCTLDLHLQQNVDYMCFRALLNGCQGVLSLTPIHHSFTIVAMLFWQIDTSFPANSMFTVVKSWFNFWRGRETEAEWYFRLCFWWMMDALWSVVMWGIPSTRLIYSCSCGTNTAHIYTLQ